MWCSCWAIPGTTNRRTDSNVKTVFMRLVWLTLQVCSVDGQKKSSRPSAHVGLNELNAFLQFCNLEFDLSDFDPVTNVQAKQFQIAPALIAPHRFFVEQIQVHFLFFKRTRKSCGERNVITVESS
jgi:hypothetical protein